MALCELFDFVGDLGFYVSVLHRMGNLIHEVIEVWYYIEVIGEIVVKGDHDILVIVLKDWVLFVDCFPFFVVLDHGLVVHGHFCFLLMEYWT